MTVAAILLLAVGVAYLPVACRRPSNDRAWTRDQAVLPYAEIQSATIRLRNIRNIRYRAVDDYDVSHYDRAFRRRFGRAGPLP